MVRAVLGSEISKIKAGGRLVLSSLTLEAVGEFFATAECWIMEQ